MSNQEYTSAETENKRNPKNRFLGLFCHASDVDDHWGFNWSFACGVVVFSIVFGVWTIFDIVSMEKVLRLSYYTGGWFPFFCVVRFISDFFVFVAIIVAILSIVRTDFKMATIAYYVLIVSLIFDVAFLIDCIVNFFNSRFWINVNFRIIIWLMNIIVLFLFCWILFCNMVDIGRKIRANAAMNQF